LSTLNLLSVVMVRSEDVNLANIFIFFYRCSLMDP
jgi:hypothetical protein